MKKLRTRALALKWRIPRKRKELLRDLAFGGGIGALTSIVFAVIHFAGSGPPAEVPAAPPAPVQAVVPVAPKVQAQKPKVKPRNALRESAQDRERIGRRLHEFGLKREFFAARGIAGRPLLSEKDLEKASASSTFATVVTSDKSQHMVSYSTLDGDCPAIMQLRGRAALKVNAEGKVIDGAYLPDTAPIPRSVIGCQVGKPAELADASDVTFITIYTPAFLGKLR